jgi:hypothetical protein
METVGFTSNLVLLSEKAELWVYCNFISFLLLIVETFIYEIKFICWYIILIFHKR